MKKLTDRDDGTTDDGCCAMA